MSEARGRLARRIGAGLVLLVLATAVAAGAAWYRARSRRLELDEARRAMTAGHLGLARQRLTRLADRWAGDGEVLVLLGECELERGRRDGGIDPRHATRRCRLGAGAGLQPRLSPRRAAPGHAPDQRGSILTGGAGRRCRTEIAARGPGTPVRSRPRLEPGLSLRGADGRRPARAPFLLVPILRPETGPGQRAEGTLATRPVADAGRGHPEAALDKADGEDDRVWLGRANLAILTGRFADAAGWLDRALERRPDGPGGLAGEARAGDGRRRCAPASARPPSTFPRGRSSPPASGRSAPGWPPGWTSPDDERRELAALIRDDPGNARSLERLAVLTFEAGQPPRVRGTPPPQGRDRPGPGPVPQAPARRPIASRRPTSWPGSPVRSAANSTRGPGPLPRPETGDRRGIRREILALRHRALGARMNERDSIQCPADRADARRSTGRPHGPGPDATEAPSRSGVSIALRRAAPLRR